MNDDYFRKQVLDRLARIEHNQQQIRKLVIAVLVLLCLGIFGVSSIIETTVESFATIALLLAAAYGAIWLFWGLFRISFKPRSDEELEAAITGQSRPLEPPPSPGPPDAPAESAHRQ